jgi:hypothetical protein
VPASAATLGAAPTAADLQSAIAAADKVDQTSPSALDARLGYADFLVEHGTGTCEQKLGLAQSQLDSVAANPATQVLFPDGSARAADIEYRIHLGRASCDADAATRARELQSSLEAAQLAMRLNRQAFNYPAMAVAQFNVAATYRALGDDMDAIRSLETALAMDSEYGLADDAQDNYALLLKWRNRPAGPDQVTQLMSDFPSRSATLKFGWTPSDASVAVSRSNTGVADHMLLHTQGARVFERLVRAQNDGWAITYVPSGGANDFGVWPRETDSSGPSALFRPTLLELPNFELTATGDFKTVTDLAGFATRVTTDAQSDIRDHAPKDGPARKLLGTAVRAAQIDFAPDVLAAQVSQGYGLEAAMWIGATLQQGVHYQLVAPLALAGVPYVTLNHQIDFVFTRELPCPGGTLPHPCVELIVQATPDGQPLEEPVGGYPMRYSSSMTVRLITDPQTLQPYLRDTRRYWYVTIGQHAGIARVLQSDRSLVTFTYR